MKRDTVGPEGEVDSNWNVMAHGDAREGKWRGNWRMQWVTSILHTTSEHGVSSITTAVHTWAAISRLNWRPRRFKWTRPFRRKTISGFCACAITFQLASTSCVPRSRNCISCVPRCPLHMYQLRPELSTPSMTSCIPRLVRNCISCIERYGCTKCPTIESFLHSFIVLYFIHN